MTRGIATRGRAIRCVFSMAFTSVAAAILAAVEGGNLPPGPKMRNGSAFSNHTPIPPGRMPGSTAGRMPAATLNRGAVRASDLVVMLAAVFTASAAPAPDFAREVRPLLEQHCFKCHGPEKQKGGLRFD